MTALVHSLFADVHAQDELIIARSDVTDCGGVTEVQKGVGNTVSL